MDINNLLKQCFREPTLEEKEVVDNYIKSISQETGINFNSFYLEDKVYLIPIENNKPIKVVFSDE